MFSKKNRLVFAKFSIVGAIGFMVDTAVLYFLLFVLGYGYLSGRFLSYILAATVTWYLHRMYTFGVTSKGRLHLQWANFLLLNSIGGIANYLTYAVLITNSEIFRAWPVFAVAAGTPIGLVINYYLSKKIVFRAE